MKARCKKCNSSYYFDDSKISEEGLYYKCPRCGDTVIFNKLAANYQATDNVSLEEREVIPRTFIEQLPEIFSYPFRGNGKIVLIGGAVFFGIINFLIRSIPLIWIILDTFVVAYLSAYMMKVISYSADGKDELPDWPDFSDWWDDILCPLFKVAGTLVFCFIPALLYYYYAVMTKSPFTNPIFLALVGLGLFYLPMGLIAVSMSNSLASLNPLLIVPSIFKVFFDCLFRSFRTVNPLMANT